LIKELGVLEITTLAGCILVLSISVLVLRYSEKRFVTGGDTKSTESL
jgi:hypothetical protein